MILIGEKINTINKEVDSALAKKDKKWLNPN